MPIRSVALVFALLLCLQGSASAQPPTPADTPSVRIGQVGVTGYIQYDYLAYLGETPQEHQMFRFRRARVQFAGPPEKDVTWAVHAELTGLPALRDAYIALNYLPAATIHIGQLIMPYGLERYVASSNTMEFTERLLADLAPGRDAGVMVSNARPFFGWLSYEAAIINGTGQNVRDNNSAKDVMLRLTASPLRLAGLHLAANAARGDQPTGMRTRTGTDVTYERRSYHLAAEFLRETTEGGRTRKHGYYGLGSWRFYPKTPRATLHHVEVAARFARITGVTAPTLQWDFAVNYYVQANLRFMCDVTVPTERTASGLGTTIHARMNIRF